MFSTSAIKYNFLKSPVKVLYTFRKNFVTKKKSSWFDISSFSQFDVDYYLEKNQNSNLTPKGFKIIYITPVIQSLRWTYIALPVLWSFLCFDAYIFFTKNDYIEKLNKRFESITYKDKVLQTVGLGILVLILQIVPSRVVVAIFRKENEFKTLMYGFLGPLTKKYVSHGFQAMEPTPAKAIYHLKGKKVLLFSNGFQNFKDFQSVVSLNNF